MPFVYFLRSEVRRIAWIISRGYLGEQKETEEKARQLLSETNNCMVADILRSGSLSIVYLTEAREERNVELIRLYIFCPKGFIDRGQRSALFT